MIRQAAILLALAAAAAAATHAWHPRAPSWYLVEEPAGEHEINMAAVLGQWQGDVIWIDARIREQFEAGHVPGAISLNEQNFKDEIINHLETFQQEAMIKNKPVVIYCGSEKCKASKKIRDELNHIMPIENIFVLKGGWQAWKQANKK